MNWRLDHLTRPAVHPLNIAAAVNGNGRSGGMKGLRPPTGIRGYVEDAAFDGILADVLELVPDVQWPTSIQRYQSPRRDAKLSALISGYELQLCAPIGAFDVAQQRRSGGCTGGELCAGQVEQLGLDSRPQVLHQGVVEAFPDAASGRPLSSRRSTPGIDTSADTAANASS